VRGLFGFLQPLFEVGDLHVLDLADLGKVLGLAGLIASGARGLELLAEGAHGRHHPAAALELLS
jgi:hypothetical protein